MHAFFNAWFESFSEVKMCAAVGLAAPVTSFQSESPIIANVKPGTNNPLGC